jgi:hypothetical protein
MNSSEAFAAIVDPYIFMVSKNTSLEQLEAYPVNLTHFIDCFGPVNPLGKRIQVVYFSSNFFC